MAEPMTQDDKDLLEKQRVNLVERVIVEDGMLLAHLRARRAIALREEEEIQVRCWVGFVILERKGLPLLFFLSIICTQAEYSRNRQVGLLLDILQKGNTDSLDKFIYSLRETGQSHIEKKWLRSPGQSDHWRQTGESESTGQESNNTNTLLKCRPELMKEIDLSDGRLLAQLVARNVITRQEEDFIKSKNGQANCVGQLATFIIQRGPDALEQFKHSLNRTRHSQFVTRYLGEPTTDDMYSSTPFVGGGSPDKLTDELTEDLRYNLQEQLERKGLLEQLTPYIHQPCTLERGFEKEEGVSMDSPRARDQTKTVVQLVEDSSPGDRIVVLGDAGMGKSTLLKHLAESWIDKSNAKLAEKFKYVFLIPMGLVGNISLLNIICDELGLIPRSNIEPLKQSLDRNERRLLFMLDSYEELREYVAKSEKADINELITGRLFSKSTVIVTTRPGTTLPQSSTYQIKAQLKNLPVEEVNTIIRQRVEESQGATTDESDDDDDDYDDDDDEADLTTVLCTKPINLALLLYVIEQGEQEHSISEAQLYSVWLQHIMLAYAKKKHLPTFTPQATKYILHEDIPNDIRRLVREMSKKCYEEMKVDCKILPIQDKNDLKDYLDFGLFTEGRDASSVILEHPFFREPLAAVHLAEEPKAWPILLEEIRQIFDMQSSRSSLFDAVNEMRLENQLSFLVAFKPEIVQDIASLFVIERGHIDECDNYNLIDFEFYSDLLFNCSDEGWRQSLAVGLLKAPVRDVDELHNWGPESGSLVLMQYLDRDQRVSFLKKAYDLELCEKDGKSTISCVGNNNSIGICDRFVVALINLYNCTLDTDKLDIGGYPDEDIELPAIMLSRNMTSVTHMVLEHCKLCAEIPDYMRIPDNEVAATPHHSSSMPTESSLGKVVLCEVEGLEHCNIITPRQCQLEMNDCADVTINTLKKCFPKVSLLELYNTSVISSTEELTSWLSTVQTVKSIGFGPKHEGEEQSLRRLLDLFSERKELTCLLLSSFSLLFDVKDTSATVIKNNTLKEMALYNCGDVNLFHLLEFCTRCLQLEKLIVDRCRAQLCRDASHFGNVKSNTLNELNLIECEGKVDLRKLSEVCWQCLQLQKLTVDRCEVEVTLQDELSGDSVEKNSRLRELRLKYCEGVVDLCQLFDVYRQFSHLKEFYAKEVRKLVADDKKVDSVRQMTGLQRCILLRSSVHTPNGQSLSQDEAKQWLGKLCPSAKVYFKLPPGDSDSSSSESSDSDSLSWESSDSDSSSWETVDYEEIIGDEITDQGPAELQELEDNIVDTTKKRTLRDSTMWGEGGPQHPLQDDAPSKRSRTMSSSDLRVGENDFEDRPSQQLPQTTGADPPPSVVVTDSISRTRSAQPIDKQPQQQQQLYPCTLL